MHRPPHHWRKHLFTTAMRQERMDLARVHVLWRRDRFCQPLELRPRASIPGLQKFHETDLENLQTPSPMFKRCSPIH